MPRPSAKKAASPAAADLLLEPSLIALRKQLLALQLGEQTVALALPEPSSQAADAPDTLQPVLISGAGAPEDGGVAVSRELLQRYSGYYSHAASFGDPPATIQLESGHRGVQLLGAALGGGSARLGPGTLPDLLQAAAFLQVAPVLDACAAHLRGALLEARPALALRLALDLGLAGLEAALEREFTEEFYMLCGERAAELLKEWPAARRRGLLGSPRLCAPTECCVLETLCRFAKCASSAEAAALLDCVCWGALTGAEAAAAALYLQHNAGWVDRRLSTAIAWRLLNARIASDLAASSGSGSRSRHSSAPAAANGGGGGGSEDGGGSGGRAARRRSLLYGLSTGALAEWSGTQVPCCEARIPCAFLQAAGSSRPMAMQLEREDPRHAAAEAVAGLTGGGGAADSGGSGWDLQLSLDPEKFPAGFRAVCFSFGAAGFCWCDLGPLVKPGPTWWKVGFLESQLPRALPLHLLGGGGGSGLPAVGSASGGDGLLLLGWWVPEQ